MAYRWIQELREQRREGWHPQPAEPTTAAPGSREKIEILRQRFERGEELWHPSDPVLQPAAPNQPRVYKTDPRFWPVIDTLEEIPLPDDE